MLTARLKTARKSTMSAVTIEEAQAHLADFKEYME